MADICLLADKKLSTLGISLNVVIFVFVVVIIPMLIVFAVIYNRRADKAEQAEAAAKQRELEALAEIGREVSEQQTELEADAIDDGIPIPETEDV